MRSWMKVAVLLLLVLPQGCGQRENLKQPIEKIKSEIPKMSVKDLEVRAESYVRAMNAKRSVLEKIKEEARSLPAKDLFGSKGKDIQSRFINLSKEMDELNRRYRLYMARIEELSAKAPPE